MELRPFALSSAAGVPGSRRPISPTVANLPPSPGGATLTLAATQPLVVVPWGRATKRAAGRLSAAAGCAERTTRRSPAVTTTRPERLPETWRCSSVVRAGGRTRAIAPRPVRARFDASEARHAASRRPTAASMNRRPSRALAHGPAAEVAANASRSLAAAAPPREGSTRVSVGRRDGQRVVDSRGDATVRRRDRARSLLVHSAEPSRGSRAFVQCLHEQQSSVQGATTVWIVMASQGDAQDAGVQLAKRISCVCPLTGSPSDVRPRARQLLRVESNLQSW